MLLPLAKSRGNPDGPEQFNRAPRVSRRNAGLSGGPSGSGADRDPGPEEEVAIARNILLAATSLCLFVLLLEGALALSGVRPALYEADPFVGFALHIPLFVEVERPGGGVDLITAPNKRKFFNVQRFPRSKREGAYRIFCLGGSTTYGRPYDDRMSFCGWLRALLPVADPSWRWQVVNAGGISYASYRVAIVMEELIGLEPDLFIVYSGHNEFLERRTYAELRDEHPALQRLRALLNGTRSYTALKRALHAATGRESRTAPRRDLLPGEVETLLDRSFGPMAYTRDDALRRSVLAHYRFNLARMVDIARSVDAEVVLVTPASNLRHCSPFKSEIDAGLPPAERERLQALLERAERARSAGRWGEGLAALEEARSLDARHAGATFRRGEALLELGRPEEARRAFLRARDEDICPLRAPSAIVELVRDVAAERSAPLVDFARFAGARSQWTIPGDALFLDHVHPTIEGQRLLALELIRVLIERGIVRPTPSWNAEAVEAVARRVESRIDRAHHGKALTNVSRVFGWAGKYEDAYRVALRAIELAPGHADAFAQAGSNASHLGELEEAISYYREAVRLDPRHLFARNNLGNTLVKRGRFEQAVPHLLAAVELDPQLVEAHYNLGLALSAERRTEEAIPHYREVLRRRPDRVEVRFGLARALAATGQGERAIAEYRRALRLRPDELEVLNNLAWMLATAEDAALREGAEAVLLAEHARALSGGDKPAILDTLAAAYAEVDRFEEAVQTARRAAELAAAAGWAELAESARRRLALYRKGETYRE